MFQLLMLQISRCFNECNFRCLSAVPRLFTPDIASFYEDYYKGKGVNIIKGTSVTAFEKDDQGNVNLSPVMHSPSMGKNIIMQASL